ncbi:hypothetical protein FB446DRAFT_291821 [Lentinula raphanica]|nr:hypothetical protein FB446DRAFT_291821 [Lentinula raphanica]
MTTSISKTIAPSFLYAKSKIPSAHLKIDDEQREAIHIRYKEHCYDELTFDADDPQQQRIALEKLADLKLDSPSLVMLESRWSSQHSQTWGMPATATKKRTVYQCACGHIAPASLKSKGREFPRSHSFGGVKAAPSQRRMSYPFTACLAHVEVTVRVNNGSIVKLCGIFEHNAGCEEARMNRLPAIPLHEHVYEVALEQLENGASLTAVQEKNQQMISAHRYRDMDFYNTEKANFRYNLLSSDNATLYNKFSRKLGINTRKEPQYNIDDWLNPEHKDFKPEVRAAIFYYRARAEKNERLKICITTDDMDQAAFKYIHHSQLIVDGTFGVCSRRVQTCGCHEYS